MLNKPLTLRTILFVMIYSAFAYVVIATLVNIKLILDLGARPLSFDTVLTALGHADGCVGPWLISQFAICFVVAACVSGGADGTTGSWATSDDDDVEFTSSWRRDDDDEIRINPATGLIMVGLTDTSGAMYGCSN